MQTQAWSVVLVISAATLAHAGVVVGTGSTELWGRSASYRTWDVFRDAEGGLSEPFIGVPYDLAFHNGRLYMANNAEARYAAGLSYQPGAAGDLTSATGLFTSGVPTLYRSLVRSFAINTSGSGYGAFGGTQASLVGLARDAGFGLTTPVFSSSGGNWSMNSPPTFSGIAEVEIDYVRSIDRFVSLSTDGFGTATVRVHPHSGSGIAAAERSFSVPMSGLPASMVQSVSIVSGGFASTLLGQSVSANEVLLFAASPADLGLSDQLVLYVTDLNGVRIGNYAVIPNVGVPFVKAITVDEANGLLFVGGRADFAPDSGVISVLSIPAPGVASMVLGTGVLASLRRRPRAW